MFVLLIKSSFILSILLLFYKLFLEKESFFANNRWYLLGTLLLTFTLPYVCLPQLVPEQGWISTRIEKVEYKEPLTRNLSPQLLEQPTIVELDQPTSTDVIDAPTPSQLQIPAKIEQDKSESKTPAIAPKDGEQQLEADEALATSQSGEGTASSEVLAAGGATSNWKVVIYCLLLLYYFGVIIFALNLLTQIGSVLFRVIGSDDKIEDGNCTIVNSEKIREPCSFFNMIFINPAAYDYETYEQILEHERIHVRKFHTIDLLLTEIAVIVLWFNPLVWIFRKEVEKNIEYQTDDLLLKGEKVEKKDYQMNLLRIATFNKPLTITTNYNQSLIKQRILKMSAQKSNPHSYWKYAFILPVLFFSLLVMNKPLQLMANGTEQMQNKVELELPQKQKLAELLVPEAWMSDPASEEQTSEDQDAKESDDTRVLRALSVPSVTKEKSTKTVTPKPEKQVEVKNFETTVDVVAQSPDTDTYASGDDDDLILLDESEFSVAGIISPKKILDKINQEVEHIHIEISTQDGNKGAKKRYKYIHKSKCDYDPSLAYELYERIHDEGLAAALTWFQATKNSRDYEKLDEHEVNNVGYELLNDEMVDAAISVFKINVEEFPDSWNVYDSLGEAYLAKGDKRQALSNYKKSVELDSNNKNGKMIISALEAK